MNDNHETEVEGGNGESTDHGFSFTEAIRTLRIERKLTIWEMARILHLPPRTVENWVYRGSVPERTKCEWVMATLSGYDSPSCQYIAWMRRYHNLTWDASKHRWLLRLTIDVGKKVVGKRVTIRLKTSCPKAAIERRDAILEGYRALGVKVRPRIQKRNAATHAPGADEKPLK